MDPFLLDVPGKPVLSRGLSVLLVVALSLRTTRRTVLAAHATPAPVQSE